MRLLVAEEVGTGGEDIVRWPSTFGLYSGHYCMPTSGKHGSEALVGEARSLHSVHDEEKPFEMELAWICEASGREFKRVPAELAAAAERQAKAALADSDMCETLFHVGEC